MRTSASVGGLLGSLVRGPAASVEPHRNVLLLSSGILFKILS